MSAAMTYQKLEHIRQQAKGDFTIIRPTMIEVGSWILPHRNSFMLGQTKGERVNRHIVDTTHLTAHRSFVAGHSEGNTSSTRPWFRHAHGNPDINRKPENRKWLDMLTMRVHALFTGSNFYNAAGVFYGDYGCYNTGAHWIEELDPYGIHVHTLEPGSYFVLNDRFGQAEVMVREFDLTVRQIVQRYGKLLDNGKRDWSNFSKRVKELWERGDYATKIGVVHVNMLNDDFNPKEPVGGDNRQYCSYHYESGMNFADSGNYVDGMLFNPPEHYGTGKPMVFLKKEYSVRKPTIVGRTESAGFPYGLKGSGTDALGAIKSLNKKAISKDVAIEKAIDPTFQGPNNVNKTYLTNQARRYIGLDATALAQGGIKTIYDLTPAVNLLNSDVSDLRQQVSKLFFEDYLLFLTANPKTRTAEETKAVVNEQQLVIGPNLQSLNWSYNVPLVEFGTNYVIENDPFLPPPPPDLQGQFLRIEMISVFAQAQRSADLPNIDSFMQRVIGLSPVAPGVMQKANVDAYLDLLEDRLYLPAGLNRGQAEVDQMREAAQAQMQRQQMMQETIPAMATAEKDMAMAERQQQGSQQLG